MVKYETFNLCYVSSNLTGLKYFYLIIKISEHFIICLYMYYKK